MTKTTISGAVREVPQDEGISGDTTIREDVVPELARRLRGAKATWVVHVRSGTKRK